MIDQATKAHDRLQSLEDGQWEELRQTASEIPDDDKRRLGMRIFQEAKSIEEVVDNVDEIRNGTWRDNLLLAGAAVGGVLAGYKMQEFIDLRFGGKEAIGIQGRIRLGGVPITGLLGLAGVIPGLRMRKSLTARNTVGLAGTMFIAGATLYTRTTPQEIEG